MSGPYEPVIGLEVHAQLLTGSKAFCGCTTKFGNEPNSGVCPVCLGLPGVLPVLNRTAVSFAIGMGLATNCTVAPKSVFARKNYFYPDLPKGYQISQYDEPACSGGFVDIDADDGGKKRVRIRRIHIEEDAGKSIHDAGPDTLVDANRCGVPLIEIVTEPDIRSPREASLCLRKIRQIAVYLGICDGTMEEGSLRCDANVSVRRSGETPLGTKAEVKNMNSFRNVERALEYEIARQTAILEEGGAVLPETLLWDADRGAAVPMRGKEESHDYRYFPEPDLPPVLVDREWIAAVAAALPEHPTARRDRFIAEYGLPLYDAGILTAEKEYADYFESALREMGARNRDEFKSVGNWVMTEILRVSGERKTGPGSLSVTPRHLGGLVRLIADGTISGKMAKEVFEEMLISGGEPKTIVESRGLVQISDETAIDAIVRDVLERNKPQVEKYRAGNRNIAGFFVGEVMKATKGRANPAVVNEILKRRLSA